MKRLLKSFVYALKGLSKAWREERNLQLQTLVGLAVLILSFLAGISRLEWLLIIIVIFLVILMELINSALERVTDVLKPRINGYVKDIKDIMAAAVLMASVLAIIVGLVVLLPYFI